MNLEQKIAALRAELDGLNGKMAAIETEADEKTEGKFTAEQREQYKGLKVDYDAKRAELAECEADYKARQDRQSKADELANTPLPRAAAPGSGAPLPNTPAAEAGEQAPAAGKLRIPANVTRMTPQNFRGVRDGRTAEERAYRCGMFMLARLSADMPNRYSFAQATQFARDQWGTHFGNDGNGSRFLVPDEFGMDMIDLRETYGVFRRLAKRRPMSGEVRTDPRRAGGLTAYAVGDNSAGTESNKSWDQVELKAKDWMVIARYTANLSADAVIAIGDDLAGEITYAFSQKEDDAGFNGDGGTSYHGIVGVRSKLVNKSSVGLVTASGNAYSEIVMADFTKVVGKLPQYADTPDTAWAMHRTFYYETVLKLLLAQGGSDKMEGDNGERRPRPVFLGYPVEFAQVLPSTEANSQVACLLGDFSKGASFGDRQDTEISFSDQATVGGESLWERKQIGVRGTTRWDINVHDVGDSTAAGPIVGLRMAGS